MKSFVVFALFVAVASAAVIPLVDPNSAVITEQHFDNIVAEGYRYRRQTSNGKDSEDTEDDYVTNPDTIAKAVKKHGFYSFINELGDETRIKFDKIPTKEELKVLKLPKHQAKWLDE